MSKKDSRDWIIKLNYSEACQETTQLIDPSLEAYEKFGISFEKEVS